MKSLIEQGLAVQAATVAAANEREALAAASGLSIQEIAMIPTHLVRPAPCVLEQDATLTFGGRKIEVTLRGYGRWTPGYSGDREQPAEPAHYDISRVTIYAGGIELDIDLALGEKELDEIADAAYEENA